VAADEWRPGWPPGGGPQSRAAATQPPADGAGAATPRRRGASGRPPRGPIRRVVEFVDAATAELPGFGAYASVLLPDAAGGELLAAMFA
jgi:hypothetical protein